MSKLILCAGAPRSGSTWQYNAVRLLAEATYGAACGSWVADYVPARPEPAHVVKIHNLDDFAVPEGASIVTSYRDLRDVAASYRRMGWRFQNSDAAVASLAWYVSKLEQSEQIAAYVMRYEAMIANPVEELRRHALALGMDVSEATIEQVQGRIDAIAPPAGLPTGGGSHYDRDTLLHPGHIAATPASLDPEMSRRVEQAHGEWLRVRGYLQSS